ncbi:collagen binding domain-containing protein [Agromyces sp. NPDC058064]|uniref:MSCRAMM family protein n=1 Tax=Agromyces sp. NPDC058064 TaxID=3346322 RepID=UPI0036DF452F
MRTQPEYCPTPTERRRHRRRSPIIATAAAVGLVLAGLAVAPAYANHPEVSLPGSDFEIDTNANLVVNDPAPSIDWAGVDEVRKPDKPTGSGDDSFGQGSKEDTLVPSVVDGSIPPNKSDLKTFGLYLETNASGHQFLNLYWHRVQDPTGTTNMDFEFNKSKTLSANGVTPVRSAGDMLIQYDLSNGGTNPVLSVSRWITTGSGSLCQASNSTPCWDKKVNFSVLGLATGSINTTAIAAGASDGLGAISARTFGEATVDYTALASTLDECETFGSAYLKSRSSDSFSAAMKDFIAPIGTGFPTCGGVKISKVTDPASTVDFTYTGDFSSDPSSASFTLSDGESQEFADVPIGVTGHVTESDLPDGWDLDFVDCDLSSEGANVSINGAEITFNLDTAEDTVDCTYHNKARGSITVEKITDSGMGAFEFTSTTLDSPFTLTTTAAGAGGKDSEEFANLVPGSYDVAETVPANWHLVSATCSGDDDGTDPAAIELDPGEDVVCTFHNERNTGAILIEKMRKHAASGLGELHPESGVTFTVTGGGLADPIVVETGLDGTVCVPGLLVSTFAGTYTVTETVPAGEKVDGSVSQLAAVATSEDDCSDVGAAASLEFENIPLTDITVSVDSLVEGGTFSSIQCVDSDDPPNELGSVDGITGSIDDPSLTVEDLEPGTYVCTVVVDP